MFLFSILQRTRTASWRCTGKSWRAGTRMSESCGRSSTSRRPMPAISQIDCYNRGNLSSSPGSAHVVYVHAFCSCQVCIHEMCICDLLSRVLSRVWVKDGTEPREGKEGIGKSV